jgi:hypothetical protein
MSKKLHPVRKSLVTAPRGRAPRLFLEELEERCVLSSFFYSVDGSGNNLSDPSRFNWGAVGQDLLRVAPAAYADGLNALAGPTRLSPRAISDIIVTDPTDGNLPNNRFMADWVYAWGQFIDHDIDLTTGGTGSQHQPANIPVPKGDPFFDPNDTGTQVIFFNRSEFDPNTGKVVNGVPVPRQQFNNITAFIDGSMIYGSDPVVADALRTHSGGMLKSSPGNFLPYNNHTYFPGISQDPSDPAAAFSIANDAHIVPDDQLFMAGDVRVNENIELTSVHTLFMREHNRIAGLIDQAAPYLDDETVYQVTRAIVIAEEQSITYNGFLPALLGPNVMGPNPGYDPTVNPDIATEFSTGGFRLGHSLLAPDVQFLNPDASTKFPPVSLANAFFNPPVLAANGADPILKYLATDNAQEIDNKIVPQLQNFLFGPPGAGGFDLASLNIQRGRDHGLSDYNTTRHFYGLPMVSSYAQITSNPTVQAQLLAAYGQTNGHDNVDNIDLWVGMLAEDHVPGGSVGPLVQRIVVDQFQRLRVGDRLFFENLYSGPVLEAFENTTLAQIISRNTVDNNLQGNVFFFKMAIRGTVFNDANANGVRDTGEGGVAGRVIRVLDPSNQLIAQTTTGVDGSFSFDNLAFPLNPATAYRVVEVLPAGLIQTTANPPALTFTRGETFRHVDFGNFFVSGGPAIAGGGAGGAFTSPSAGSAESAGALISFSGTLSAPGGAPTSPAPARRPDTGSGLAPFDLGLAGGNAVSVGLLAGVPGSANAVTVSGGAGTTSQVTAVLVQPSGADSGLALLGAADAGASTPSDPLAAPVTDLNGPGVTVL